jgi:hypothetical protein
MAGAGYRTWTAGEVVTASNVQSYLQDQTVGVYAGTAARSSAILSPSEGQVSYRTDDDIVEVYNGTAWTPIAPTNSGLIHIETVSFSASSSESLNNVFSSTYDNYKILIKGLATTTINFRLRAAGSDNSTANSYVLQLLRGDGAAAVASRTTSTLWQSAFFGNTLMNSAAIDIFNPFLATATSIQIFNTRETSSALLDLHGGTHNQTVSYDGFTIAPNSGTMTGLVSVYGYRKS